MRALVNLCWVGGSACKSIVYVGDECTNELTFQFSELEDDVITNKDIFILMSISWIQTLAIPIHRASY